MFKQFSTKSIKDASELTNSTLSLLHIIFRHGNRTPVRRHTYPTDPWKEMDYKPYGYGQLTNASYNYKRGKQTMYNLGRYIRDQYDDFLGKYFPGVVEARTTNVDRTQCSLQLFLAGLYPPAGETVWDPSLLWQPIPYITYLNEKDKIMQAFTNDPYYKSAYTQYQQEIGFTRRYRKLISYIEHHTKKKIENMDDIWLLYFKLLMQMEMGLELPEWTRSVFPDPFEELAALNYLHTCATPKLRRYVLKNFTDKIIEDTYRNISDNSNILIHIYSGHEMNVAHTLIALNSFRPPHIPQYGACVILEVHKIKNDTYIKGLYKRESDPHVEMLPFWDKNPVNLKEFVELISLNY